MPGIYRHKSHLTTLRYYFSTRRTFLNMSNLRSSLASAFKKKITILPGTHVPSSILKDLDDPKHVLSTVWPSFINRGSKVSSERHGLLWDFPELLRWTFVAILSPENYEFSALNPEYSDESSEDESDEEDGTCRNVLSAVGLGVSVPFHWETPDIDQSLPDDGWEKVLTIGTNDYLGGKVQKSSSTPNALSAISIAVDPAYRLLNRSMLDSSGQHIPIYTYLTSSPIDVDVTHEHLAKAPLPTTNDVATSFLMAMRTSALEAGLKGFVAPLRPTYKSRPENVRIPMEEYIKIKRAIPAKGSDELTEVAYDPWLRKHMGVGGRPVKVCPRSYVVIEDLDKWESWTGLDFEELNKEQGGPVEGRYFDVVVPGALVPVVVDRVEKIGTYIEPNVWVRHF